MLPVRNTLNAFYGADLSGTLEQRGTTHVLVAGSVAEASVDSTGRMAVELDYDVTFVRDGIAALDPARYHHAVNVTFPRLASRVITAGETLRSLAPPA